MSTGELEVQPAVRDGKSGDGSESSHEETAKPQTEVTETAASQPTSNANETEQPASTASEIPTPNTDSHTSSTSTSTATGASTSTSTSTATGTSTGTSTGSGSITGISSGSGEALIAAVPVTTEAESHPAEVKTEVAVAEGVVESGDQANKTAESKDKPTTPTKEDERQRKEREKREEQSRKDKEAAKKQREQKEREQKELPEKEKAEQKDPSATTALSSTTPTVSPNVTPAKSKKNKKSKKDANAVNATASTSGVATTTPSSTAPSTQAGTTTSEPAKNNNTNANANNASTNNASNGFSQADILAKINASMSFYEGKIREQMQACQAKETHVQQQLATQIFETSFKSTEKAISAFVASPALQTLVTQIANRIDESCTNLFNQVIVPLVHQRIAYVFQQTVAINGRVVIDETLKENIANVVAPSLKNLFAELVTQVSRNFEIGLRFTLEQQLKQQSAVKKVESAEEDETVAELTRLAERMTQHIVEIQNKIVDQLLDSSEFGARAGGEGRASQADPVAMTRQIESHLGREDYNAAFEVALGSQNLEILTWTLSIVNPEDVFAKNPLPQDKIIATIQQAGCSLSLSPNVKLEWLQVLLLELDESDSTNKKYGRAVLSELLESLRGLDQATQMSGLKLLIRQVEKKLRSF